jgi:hypothetical protein
MKLVHFQYFKGGSVIGGIEMWLGWISFNNKISLLIQENREV